MTSNDALPDPPAQLKAVQPYIRIAQDVERVDPVVAYWTRLYSTETALKIDKGSPECKSFLTALILWLEKFKQSHKDNETVNNQTVGQAHVENFVVALFNKADTIDRDGKADKNTVRMFYMAALLFEAMAVFGPLTEEVSKKAKYAKFKAAYIQKCIKQGITPKPGPIENADLEGDQSRTEPDAPTVPPNTIQTNTTVRSPDGFSQTNTTASSGVLNIPEVPSDTSSNSGPAPKDPFILTPSNTSDSHPPPVSTISTTNFQATNGMPLSPEDIIKSQKYCKFANSALQYDDIPTAVANLEKALRLLTTGKNPEA